MAEDPTSVAQEAQTSAPVVVCFEDVDETSSYYLIIEKKVPIGGLTSFSKSLALWFSLHYIFKSEYDKSIPVYLWSYFKAQCFLSVSTPILSGLRFE